MNQVKYPRSFSHIGITVPDIKKAVEFYEEVMGFRNILSFDDNDISTEYTALMVSTM